MASEQERLSVQIRFPRRWWTRAALGCAVIAATAAPAAWASHEFTDVPTASPHHGDISTILRAGITGGCAPGLYCPAEPVRRDQMGSFLARTLRSLTPAVRSGSTTGNPLDVDAESIACQTTDFTPSVQVHAFVRGWVGLRQSGAGELGWWLQPVRSTNGGASWTEYVFQRGALSTTENAVTNALQMHQELRTAGTPVRYGLRVERASGTADADSAQCEIEAVYTYADAGASALGS